MKISSLLIKIGFFLIACSTVAFSSILKDSFDDENRRLQSLPNSVAYFTSQNADTLVEGSGVLALDGFNANRFLLAYFTEPGSYIDLEAGEAISLKFTFRPDIANFSLNRHLRLALFESGDSRGDVRAVVEDGFGSNAPNLKNYRGYQSSLSFENSSNHGQMVLAKRHKTFDDLLIVFNPTHSGYSHLAVNGQGAFESKQLYTAQLNIICLDSGKAEVQAMIVAGGPDSIAETECFVRVMDANAPSLRFDCLAIGLNAADGTVRNIHIEELEVFKIQVSEKEDA